MDPIKIQTYGSDPEMFIYDKQNEEFVSAEGIIPGTKETPEMISDRGHGIQPDNVMLELTFPPVVDADSLKRELKYCIDHVNERIKKINPYFEVVIIPSATLDDKYTKTEHALTVGCSVDYNAWLQDANPKVDVENTNERWAGGHIHFGVNNQEISTIELIVKAFDMFLGVPFVFMDPYDARKKVYGTAGRFRFTSYGGEYRTLSNYWLSSDELIDYVFSQMSEALSFINAGNQIPEEVQEIINNVDKEKALAFCNKFKIKYLTINVAQENTTEDYRIIQHA